MRGNKTINLIPSSWSVRKIARAIKRAGRLISGRDVTYKYDAHPPKEFVGTDYGGWTIVPGAINETSIIYSFGIGNDISFDLCLIDRFGAHVHGFDPTPQVAQWIAGQTVPKRFHFHSYGLGARNGSVPFFVPVNNAGNYSLRRQHKLVTDSTVSLEVKTLAAIAESLQTKSVAVLKIDIEGAEYDILPTLIECPVPIDQLLIEFHHRAGVESLKATIESVNLLRSAGFQLFHVSETSSEFSFAHRRFLQSVGAAA